MSYLIPSSITRLQTTAFISDRNPGTDRAADIVVRKSREMAEAFFVKAVKDFIKVEQFVNDYDKGLKLELDCYVLSKNELEEIVKDAIIEGMKEREIISERCR